VFFSLAEPFLEAVTNDLAEVFKLASRLIPEILEGLLVDPDSKSRVAPHAFSPVAPTAAPTHFVFVISGELAAGHRGNRQRASRRKRLENRCDARIKLPKPPEDPVVLFYAECGNIRIAPGPFGLQGHPGCAAQNVHELFNFFLALHIAPLTSDRGFPQRRGRPERARNAFDDDDGAVRPSRLRSMRPTHEWRS